MRYYIADLHLGHANIIKLCYRPFTSVEEMNQTLIDNWNSVVTDKDEVFILGDFCFRSQKNPVSFLKQLNGTKYLIKGNHDKVNDEMRKEFAWVRDYAEISDNGHMLILCHYPMAEWNGFYRDTIHLYGHIHNSINATYHFMKSLPNAYNVGADILDFTPRTLDEVIRYNRNFNASH